MLLALRGGGGSNFQIQYCYVTFEWPQVQVTTIFGCIHLVTYCAPIRLFANDVIMIGSVRADWPAPFSVTIGNPRADKLGRNGFECIGRRCLFDRDRFVRATYMHSAIENYSMLHLQRWLECRGIKRFGTKSLFMIISHNCQSCMCRQ